MMNSIDFTPLYRSSIGFDRPASFVDHAMQNETTPVSYPPYNIEVLEDDRYTITIAVAGFEQGELDISVDKGVLTVRGDRVADSDNQRKYLYQGITDHAFERRFNLADYVEISGARLDKGLLTIDLVREIPDSMKPKRIPINQEQTPAIDHKTEQKTAKAA